jgi:hypothetical protein
MFFPFQVRNDSGCCLLLTQCIEKMADMSLLRLWVAKTTSLEREEETMS